MGVSLKYKFTLNAVLVLFYCVICNLLFLWQFHHWLIIVFYNCNLSCYIENLSSTMTHWRPLHMLILNAGVFGLAYTKTEDDLEMTFQVNHLAQFYLTKLLWEVLAASSPSRVVIVSSESHRYMEPLTVTLGCNRVIWSFVDWI